VNDGASRQCPHLGSQLAIGACGSQYLYFGGPPRLAYRPEWKHLNLVHSMSIMPSSGCTLLLCNTHSDQVGMVQKTLAYQHSW
jgi:hypothetical protein